VPFVANNTSYFPNVITYATGNITQLFRWDIDKHNLSHVIGYVIGEISRYTERIIGIMEAHDEAHDVSLERRKRFSDSQESLIKQFQYAESVLR